MRVILAILRALGRVIRRDLATFQSAKVNNFFLFVALLIYGALVSGVKPASAYPFLLVLGMLLLFPLSSDPLARIPANRLALWPLSGAQHAGLRVASLALSPVLWATAVLLLRTSWKLGLAFAGAALAAQALLAAARQAVRITPRGNPARWVPLLPIRLGMLVRKDLRQMLCTLDFFLALLVAATGTAWRFGSAEADREALPVVTFLVGLALSTYGQCLFGLDSASGSTRYRLLPVRGWEILLAKGVAFLGILVVLVTPLDPVAGMAFGLTALAAGNVASVWIRIPQMRWRFASGRLVFGIAQVLPGAGLAVASTHWGAQALLLAGGMYGWSVYRCGQRLDGAAEPERRG